MRILANLAKKGYIVKFRYMPVEHKIYIQLKDLQQFFSRVAGQMVSEKEFCDIEYLTNVVFPNILTEIENNPRILAE